MQSIQYIYPPPFLGILFKIQQFTFGVVTALMYASNDIHYCPSCLYKAH